MTSEQRLQQQVQEALATKRTLRIVGGNSKAFYGDPAQAVADIHATEHAGIIAYEPSELVLTANAGTSLREIEAVLAEANQQLPFEPPDYTGTATLGGMVAAGLSGPRRIYAGALRDAVLGVKLINGLGEIVTFGGQVMKNVAGFDISRLMAGSLGTLGLLLQVSLKTRPIAHAEITFKLSMPVERALGYLRSLVRQPVTISATAWFADTLYIRLIGSEEYLEKIGTTAQPVASAEEFWAAIKNHQLDFFTDHKPLWRLSLPADSPLPDFDHDLLLEWHGSLRWLSSQASAQQIRDYARQNRGHACRFDRSGAQYDCFQSLNAPQAALHHRLKHAFDPEGIFNPGRMASLFSPETRTGKG